jgi:hypothetical protein
MADHDDGENYFDDDDLDALPADAFLELENHAIQSTQAHRPKAPPSSDYGDDFEDGDLDDAVVIDESRSTPAIVPILRQNAPGQATQREQFRQQRYGAAVNANLVNRQRYNPPPKFNDSSRLQLAPIVQNAPQVDRETEDQTPGPDLTSLQRQVEEVLSPSLNYLPNLTTSSYLKSGMLSNKTSMPRQARLRLLEVSRRRRQRNMRGKWLPFESSIATH